MTSPAPADREWFESAVVALLPDLFGTALRLTRNRADAEDLVADAIAKEWASLDGLADRERLRGWMFRILTNTFISARRAEERRGVHEPLDEGSGDDGFSLFERLHPPVLLWWGNPEQEFLNSLLREDLAAALDGLPEPFRLVVVLADVEGFAYQEIADTLNIPIGTVRSRLARGRAILQKALWAHAQDAGLVAPAPAPAPETDRETAGHD